MNEDVLALLVREESNGVVAVVGVVGIELAVVADF